MVQAISVPQQRAFRALSDALHELRRAFEADGDDAEQASCRKTDDAAATPKPIVAQAAFHVLEASTPDELIEKILAHARAAFPNLDVPFLRSSARKPLLTANEFQLVCTLDTLLRPRMHRLLDSEDLVQYGDGILLSEIVERLKEIKAASRRRPSAFCAQPKPKQEAPANGQTERQEEEAACV